MHCRFALISALVVHHRYNAKLFWRREVFQILWAKKWKQVDKEWDLQSCLKMENLCMKEITIPEKVLSALHNRIPRFSAVERINTLSLTSIQFYYKENLSDF